MKFTPETLLQIYMNGSFTEEAQEAFDKLMRRDPVFAEKVTQAVAERLGSAPESALEQIEVRLDAKAPDLWARHKLSPSARGMKILAKVLLLTALGSGIFGGWRYFRGSFFSSQSNSQVSLGSSPESSPRKADSSPAVARSPGLTREAIPDGGSEKNTPGPLEKTIGATSWAGTAEKPKSGSSEKAAVEPFQSRTVSAVSQTGSLSFSFSKTPFAGQTQEGNRVQVSVTTPEEKKVTVTVLDSKGLTVRRLYQGAWTAGVHWVDWDGKDELGNPAVSGNYTVLLNADGKIMSDVVVIQEDK